MLDGLLGRGFVSKCKDLIKSMKKRIDVIRRKRNATQKFLKKDIADLLANGLDINAYGRAEGLLVELKISWCYDFVEQCSDFVMKNLLISQKLSTCPENCREAVSSIMFAAARFSDLPELRDLREMLQEKYGHSLEYFVNQEFVENLASKPATLDRKVQSMNNIALEFSIAWDSVAFEKRMSQPSVNKVDEHKTYGSSFDANVDRSKFSNGKETESRGAKDDLFCKPVNVFANGGHRFQGVNIDDVSRKIELTYPLRQESFDSGNEICNGKVAATLEGRKAATLIEHEIDCRKGEAAMEILKCGSISHRRRQERRIGRSILCNGMEITLRLDVASSHEGEAPKDDKKPSYSHRRRGNEDSMKLSGKLQENENRKLKPDYKNSHPPPYINLGRENVENLSWKLGEDENRKLKPDYKNSRPPPYINSSSRMKDYNSSANCKSPPADNDSGCSSAGFLEQIRFTSHFETSHYDHEREGQKQAKDYDHEREGSKLDFRHDERDQFYDARLYENSLPKPRSIRRKHSKSRANSEIGGNLDDTCVARRKSRGRRRDESTGLKLLMDEEKDQKDEEERIIDKLLIHYSKKPSKLDPAKVRKKPRSHHRGELPRLTESLVSAEDNSDKIRLPDTVSLAVRSFSLPHEQIGHQPNGLNEANDVHSKLPDYEDLTARFVALRGR